MPGPPLHSPPYTCRGKVPAGSFRSRGASRNGVRHGRDQCSRCLVVHGQGGRRRCQRRWPGLPGRGSWERDGGQVSPAEEGGGGGGQVYSTDGGDGSGGQVYPAAGNDGSGGQVYLGAGRASCKRRGVRRLSLRRALVLAGNNRLEPTDGRTRRTGRAFVGLAGRQETGPRKPRLREVQPQ